MTSQKKKTLYICCIFTFRSRFSQDALKRCIFVAFLRGKAGFSFLCKTVYLMEFCVKSCQRCVYSMHFTWTSRFSHDAAKKPMTIWCISTFKSKFFHDTPKTFIFGALLCGKAGFLMIHQKLKCVYWCIIKWRSSLSHGTPNYHYIWYIFSLKTAFYRDAKDKNECIWFIIRLILNTLNSWFFVIMITRIHESWAWNLS